ncbi:MAG TPA: caspase family protein, partial [Allocoleopsis sp.]
MCPAILKTSCTHPLETGAAKLWILLVGVNQYHDETLPNLRYSAVDCQGLGTALAEATQAFPQKEVYVYHDFAPQQPTLKTVCDRLQQIVSAAAPEDTLLLYFSGHGVLNTGDQNTSNQNTSNQNTSNQTAGDQPVVLCLADTENDRLLETGLPLADLLRQLESCAAHQQLIWLDACHSGGMTLRGSRDQTAPTLPNPTSQLVDLLRQRAARSKGFYALLSCDQSQRSWEFPELGHGVFTYYLMRGLRGEAADGQGVIEADGLYKYVYHQTLRYIDQTNQQIRLVNQQKSSRGDTQFQAEYPLQTPKRIVEGVGELVIGVQNASMPEAGAAVRSPHPRQALIIEGFPNHQLTLELSKTLRADGAFDIDYFPRPGQDWSELRSAIQARLTQAEATTVLLYLHGRLEETAEGESWFLVGDVRLHCSWLRQILRQAVAAQHIIILDCPGAASLSRWIEEFQL